MNDNLIEFEYVKIIRETEKSWLIDFGNEENVWLPKSRCLIDRYSHEIEIPEWLAFECGLI
jgi:hypothetical protein